MYFFFSLLANPLNNIIILPISQGISNLSFRTSPVYQPQTTPSQCLPAHNLPKS
jgi:hypothetical protein